MNQLDRTRFYPAVALLAICLFAVTYSILQDRRHEAELADLGRSVAALDARMEALEERNLANELSVLQRRIRGVENDMQRLRPPASSLPDDTGAQAPPGEEQAVPDAREQLEFLAETLPDVLSLGSSYLAREMELDEEQRELVEAELEIAAAEFQQTFEDYLRGESDVGEMRAEFWETNDYLEAVMSDVLEGEQLQKYDELKGRAWGEVDSWLPALVGGGTRETDLHIIKKGQMEY